MIVKINFKPEHFIGVFPPSTKPARPGWYRVDPAPTSGRLPSFFAHYDGKEWGWTCTDPNDAPETHAPGASQTKWWAGLSFDPNALHL